MATVYVNGNPTEVANSKLNLIQASRQVGVEIPHYCWHAELSVVASCRMCLVEVGERKPDGTVSMLPKLVPACQTPAKDGTVVVTNSEKVRQAQAATLEYLLLNHPLDCPTCDQAGECYLQDYSFNFGRAESRLNEPKVLRADKPYIGDQITLFTDRCVMCSRCVRFTREFSGTAELQIINRGNLSEIDIFPGMPCNNKLAGNVVDLCPVGALCSKDFLYKQRVWWLQSKDSVCPNCSTGCSIQVDENKDSVYRLRPRPNPQAQGYFMCDDGRFGWKYVHRSDRLLHPMTGRGEKKKTVRWEEILPVVRRELAAAVADGTGSVAGILSPWMTCEEAYLFADYLKRLSSETRLFLGPIPIVGEDDTYPKDVRGNPAEPVRFTIRAEKCPNRRGVEAVLRHFEGKVVPFEGALLGIESGEIKNAYVVGGYSGPWLEESQIDTLKKLELFILQDILSSPVVDAAHYVLSGGSFAEKDGMFVNHAGLAQAINRAIKPNGEARSDGRILWDLAERRGLFHPAVVREDIVREIPEFADVSPEDLGDLGVFVRSEGLVASAT